MRPTRYIPIFCGLLTIAIAALVMLGWIFDIQALKSVLAEFITMKPNTALCFLLSALALIFSNSKLRGLKLAVLPICTLVAVIAGTTLVEYLWDLNLGIDEFLFRDVNNFEHRFAPGRPAPITCLNFLLLSVSLIAVQFPTQMRIWASQFCSGIVLLFAFQSLIGYLLHQTNFFGSAFYTKMALHTALAFLFLSYGAAVLYPDEGFTAVFSKRNNASRISTLALIASVLIPSGVRFLALVGKDHSLFDQDFAQLIQVVATTALMAMMTILAGVAMMKSERDREAVHEIKSIGENKYRALVEASAQMSWAADAAGNGIGDSETWGAFTGQSGGEGRAISAKGWLDAIHPDDQTTTQAQWTSANLSMTTFDSEYRLKHVSGTWRWTAARAVPLLKTDGTLECWVGMNQDIHERKLDSELLQTAKDLAEKARSEAERARVFAEAAKDEAERANYLKTAFLTNMSHEIRTPLGAMIGFADLMRDHGLTASERSNYINILLRNGEQLAHLINDILDLSKVESGHLTLEYVETDHRKIGSDVISLMQVKAKEKDLALEYEVDPSTPETIISDPTRVRQILLNLVGNAIKFTQFGSVRVKTRGFETVSGQKALCFEVMDTGMGMSETQISKLFQTFSQADESITRRFGGTGLGLALSKRLAEALGGDITVLRTQEGVGTTFLVKIADLPERRSAPEDTFKTETRTVIDIPERALDGLKILVVDDAPDNQQLIWRYLNREGAAIDSAENGLMGYRAALKGNYDLVLMDIQMPVMDGYTATQKLREAGYNKPIVALTAHAMNDIRKKALGVGYTDHLTKPIEAKELILAIIRLTRPPPHFDMRS